MARSLSRRLSLLQQPQDGGRSARFTGAGIAGHGMWGRGDNGYERSGRLDYLYVDGVRISFADVLCSSQRHLMPNADSVILMTAIDRLSKGWRELVYEYGYNAVMNCIDDGLGLEDADDALWLQRSAKQAQWLATTWTQKAWA